VDVKTIAYISQGKDLIKINKTMLFNPLNLSKNKKYIIGAAKNDANHTIHLSNRFVTKIRPMKATYRYI